MVPLRYPYGTLTIPLRYSYSTFFVVQWNILSCDIIFYYTISKEFFFAVTKNNVARRYFLLRYGIFCRVMKYFITRCCFSSHCKRQKIMSRDLIFCPATKYFVTQRSFSLHWKRWNFLLLRQKIMSRRQNILSHNIIFCRTVSNEFFCRCDKK